MRWLKCEIYKQDHEIEKLELKVCGKTRDFTGGAVVRNPPANAGAKGASPGPGRSHMPWSS